MTTSNDGWLSRRALLAHLAISEKTLRQLLRDGLLPAPSIALGENLPRWSRAEVDQAMAARRLPVGQSSAGRVGKVGAPRDFAAHIAAVGKPSDYN